MTSRTLIATTAALSLLGATFAGEGAAKPKDACGFLTRAEVAAAIGEPVASVTGGASATGALNCTWTGKDSHLVSAGVNLIVATDHVAQRYSAYRAQNPQAKTAVAGVGVAAVTDGSIILARSSKAFIQIGASRDMKLAVLRGLAKKALARA